MRKLAGTGNHKPGWYAGAKMIRRVSQGNPRLFIQVMCELFERARSSKLTAKTQHEVIYTFAQSICESTKALEVNGPKAYKNLDKIATMLSKKVHGEFLVTGGNTFKIKYTQLDEVDKELAWLRLAIAYLRVAVDEKTKRNGITIDTKFTLSNAYAFFYWIPIRSDVALAISLDASSNEYKVASKRNSFKNKQDDYHQISIFEVTNEDD